MSHISLSRQQSVSDQQQYRLIYAMTFPLFLAVAAVGRAGRRMAGQKRPAGTPRSLFAEARAAGSNALLFTFSG